MQWQVHHNNVLCCDLVAAEYLPPCQRLVLHSSVPPRNNENVCSVVTNSPGLPGLPHPCNTRFLEAQNSPDSFCKRALPKTGLFYKRALPILHHMLFAFSVPCRQVQEVFLLQKSSKNSVSRRGGGLGSRPTKMYVERLGDGVEYHLMSPTPRR